MRRLRHAIAVSTVLLALAACADDGDAADEASASGSSSVASVASGTSASPQPTDSDTRLVAHDKGETEVPTEPQRVVTLDSSHLDTALSLDVTPVGSVRSSEDEALPEYLADRAEEIEIVGTIEEPNLEAIAALNPDLILSATVRHEALYDELSGIAPTVFTESSGTNWKDGFTLVAEALGKAEEGEAALTEFDDRATELGEELGADGMSASIVRFLPEETRIYGPETFSGSVLTDVGFSLPDLDYDEYSMVYISPEQIEQADSDVLFSTVYGDPETTTEGAVEEVWGNLPAVESGCQFDVADNEWMIGIGLIGAEIILDDLEESLASADCG